VTDWPCNLVNEGISDRVTQQVIEGIRLFVISLENYLIVFYLLGNYYKIQLET
jgi:hypothetical protein